MQPWYGGNLRWLPTQTIFLTEHGSHAYGTATPESDLDLRGIAVAPPEYYLGFSHVFEQAVETQPHDLQVFDVKKFFRLACDANPNVLEILYTDPGSHWILTPAGEKILAARDLFLSRKAKHTFSGYAMSQLKRIETHRRWLLNPAETPPTRAEFGLPERGVLPKEQLDAAQAAIRKVLDSWSWKDLESVDPATRTSIQEQAEAMLTEVTAWNWEQREEKLWTAAVRKIGLDENFIELLDRERRYTAKLRNYQQYQEWKTNRNPKRAALEAKHGYDCKHGAHLYRLMTMCREILSGEGVIVKRPDADLILHIRNGGWSYDKLISWAKEQDLALAEIEKKSKLPRTPDRGSLDELCQRVITDSLGVVRAEVVNTNDWA